MSFQQAQYKALNLIQDKQKKVMHNKIIMHFNDIIYTRVHKQLVKCLCLFIVTLNAITINAEQHQSVIMGFKHHWHCVCI
jgi:hypothetical protein